MKMYTSASISSLILQEEGMAAYAQEDLLERRVEKESCQNVLNSYFPLSQLYFVNFVYYVYYVNYVYHAGFGKCYALCNLKLLVNYNKLAYMTQINANISGSVVNRRYSTCK